MNLNSEKLPTFSVIIPVYAIGNFLNRAVASVQRQNYENIEIICVNNENILAKPIFENVANTFENVKTLSGSEDFGTLLVNAVKSAEGEYVIFLGSDDLLPISTMEVYSDKLEKFRGEMILGNYRFYNDDDPENPVSRENPNFIAPKEEEGEFCLTELPEILEENLPSGCVLFEKQFILDKLSDYRQENNHGRFYFDSFLLKALFKAEKICRLRKPTCNKGESRLYDLYPAPELLSDEIDCYLNTFDGLICRESKIEAGVYAHAVVMAYRGITEGRKDLDSDDRFSSLKPVLERIDFDVLAAHAEMDIVFKYFDMISPVGNIQSSGQKVLIYNWLPFDNKWHWGGGVTVYCYNIIKAMLDNNPDINIYFISSGFAYNSSVDKTYIRSIGNVFGKRVHQFEIVNSPVPAEQRNIYVNPLVALENEELKGIFSEFMEKMGPFKAVHFNNIEGLSLDVLDLKRVFPETKFIFSIHNYVPICVNGSYFMRHKHCNCNPDHTGEDCFRCTRMDIRSHIADNIYKSGLFGTSQSAAISQNKWLEVIGLDTIDKDVSPDEILKFAQTATFKINENCDSILAVSKRVYDIARDNGFLESKMQVSYIGTLVAKNQIGHGTNKAENGLKLVFLGSDINFEEKGYQFLLRTLSELDPKYASMIDMVLTVKQKEHSEIYTSLSNFRSVKVINGYTHDDLYDIFDGCNLSIVPVLWEDNLPQIAIESVAYGVPVLSSSAGGASELCDSELFRFECGNGEDLRNKIIAFLEKPELLDEYWKHHHGLVTMKMHMDELLGIYGVKTEGDDSVKVSGSDISLLIRENEFLQGKVELSNLREVTKLRQRLEEAKNENKKLKLELKKMKKINGKIVFQTVNDAQSQELGANIIKIIPEDFNFSDFYAEIKFVRLNNVAASVNDTLTISGTWFDDGGERKLHIHQMDWEKNEYDIKDYIGFYIRGNILNIFVKHLGQFSGMRYDVIELTNRAATDTVVCEIVNNGFVYKNETLPDDSFNSLN